MASAINNGTFTFNPEELKDWSMVINELTFGDPTLNAVHDVQQGIKHQEQIVFAGRIGPVGKKIGANCTPNEISGVTLTEKFWDPAFEDFRLSHCSSDVNQQDKLVNQMTRMNPDYFTVVEGSQSSIGNFLVERVIDGVGESLWWKVWFDRKDASTSGSGSGSEDFTTGSDVDFWNSFDGIWYQIYQETNLTTGGKYYSDALAIRNAGATYGDQVLIPGEAIAAMKDVYNKADSRLRSRQDARFLATRSMYDGVINDLETIQNVGGFTQTNENGMSVLRYRGIEVTMMDTWDRFIDKYKNSGTNYVRPHRVVLTVSSNIPVGTLAEGDFGTVDAFYDRTLKTNFIDGEYSLDSKLLEDYLACVAY